MLDLEAYAANRSCPSHCCKNHGCKYAHEDCPVTMGEVPQESLCELCTWDLERIGRYQRGMASTGIVVGYSREDKTTGNLPDEAAVLKALRAALTNLDLGDGWTVQLVEN